MKNQKDLPPELAPWSAQIQATQRPYIQFSAKKDGPLAPEQSRLGGQPYWPVVMDYPTGGNGAPLHLLVQLNFAEIPTRPPLPEQGLLQIFIADDPLYGMDYQAPSSQEDFRVIFHPHLTNDLLNDFSFLPEPEDFPLPPDAEYALQFSPAQGPAPADTPAFAQQLGEHFFDRFGNEKWIIQAAYNRYAHAAGHKLGGYPHFPQEDPRTEGEASFLLLQLDSDTETGLLWGDRGTAHFFIEPSDLLELNFDDRVFYNWSSY